ncbi:MAG TPA: TetR/AcrR family transcriptional regulator [Acidimicrobiales bacterium]|nr:TetR/AcrR family transcriptional regulator [Acidimicrobiales bacterium]
MPETSNSTKDRIVDEAMRLFAEKGYRGASIAQIEAASGLSPGAGGLYRHFDSKEELLAAGVRRHLDRLDALREVREVFSGFGDLRSELAITARYFLAELDSQSELLRILVTEQRQRPHVLKKAVDELISSTYKSFADWLGQVVSFELDQGRAMTIATLGMGSLLSSRLLRNVIGVKSLALDDDEVIPTWVEMVMSTLPESDV